MVLPDRQLLDAIPDVMVVVDGSGNIVLINRWRPACVLMSSFQTGDCQVSMGLISFAVYGPHPGRISLSSS